jgi:hypothetical protein
MILLNDDNKIPCVSFFLNDRFSRNKYLDTFVGGRKTEEKEKKTLSKSRGTFL